MKNMKYVLVALLCAQVCQAGFAPTLSALSRTLRLHKLSTQKPVIAGDVVGRINKKVAEAQAKLVLHESAAAELASEQVLVEQQEAEELAYEQFLAKQQEAAKLADEQFLSDQQEDAKNLQETSEEAWSQFVQEELNNASNSQNNKQDDNMPKTGYFSKFIKGMGALFVLKGVAVLSVAGVAYAKNQSNESVVVNPAESAIDPIQQNLEDDKIALLATGGSNITVEGKKVDSEVAPKEIISAPSRTSAVISSIVAHPYAVATAAVATIAAAAYSLWYGESQTVLSDKKTDDELSVDDVELALRKQKNQ